MASAILAFCSTNRIVMPCLLTSLMISKISLTSSGDRPIDGSSIRIILGFPHQGAAHGQHLLLTAGKGACQLAFALFQAGEPLVDIGHRFGHIGRIRESSHLQVLFHRHLGEDVPSFRHMRQL